MGYRMTEEQVSLRDMVRDWAEKEVKPQVAELDEKGECPKELVQQGFDMGLHIIEVPEEYGGLGLGLRETAIISEEVSRIDFGLATSFFVTAMALKCVMNLGNDEQKQRAMDLVAGGKHAAFCLTEPDAGSDSVNLRTKAVRDGDNYILDGTKCFITNGGLSNLYIVMAVTDKDKGAKGISAFMVERDRPGLSIGKEEDKLGARLSNTTDVILENVVVPKENLLGGEGLGFIMAMKTLDSGRASVAASAIGIAQRALEESIAYAKQRNAFGRPIIELQAIQFMLADMAKKIEASRLLTEGVINLHEAGQSVTKAVAIAKCFASDSAMEVTTDAIQVFGGYGYMKEYPVEKLFRDAKILQIVEGSNQIQRTIIAKSLMKDDGLADYVAMQ